GFLWLIRRRVARLEFVEIVLKILPGQNRNVPEVIKRLEMLRPESHPSKSLLVKRNLLLAVPNHRPEPFELEGVHLLPAALLIAQQLLAILIEFRPKLPPRREAPIHHPHPGLHRHGTAVINTP